VFKTLTHSLTHRPLSHHEARQVSHLRSHSHFSFLFSPSLFFFFLFQSDAKMRVKLEQVSHEAEQRNRFD